MIDVVEAMAISDCKRSRDWALTCSGFTLIELMIVLVIVAVLAVIVAPAFSTLTQRTKMKSYANEVVSSVYLARSEAVKRNAPIVMCASDSGTDCDGGGTWGEGWILKDPNDVVLRQYESLGSGIVMFELSSTGFNSMTFLPSGVSTTAASLKVCQQTPSEGIEEKVITVSPTGRTRVETKTDGCP